MSDPKVDLEKLRQTLVQRPPFHIRSLPVYTRWEVTRRHPYYLQAWEMAKQLFRKGITKNPFSEPLGIAAVLHLAAIDFVGKPLDPSRSADQLDPTELNAAWASGAIEPISLRGLASLLIRGLSPSSMKLLAEVFAAIAAAGDQDDEAKANSFLKWRLSKAADLDALVDEPIVSINPAASLKQINDALAKELPTWKEKKSLNERRDRSKRYSEYLQVWDVREGWGSGDYSRVREKSIRDIARELKQPESTVLYWYHRAFWLITGHNYTRELYAKLFFPLKMSEVAIDYGEGRRRYRPLKSPARYPVAESILQRESVYSGVSPSGYVESLDLGSNLWEVLDDIRTLVVAGSSDDEVMHKLELTPDQRELISYVRGREDVSSSSREIAEN